MGDDLIAGRQRLESVWRRASKDAWALIRTPPFYVLELIVTGVAVVSAVTLIDEAVIQAAASAIIAPIALLALGFIVTACRVPFKQRNEARKEILELRHQQKPKLWIRGAMAQDLPREDYNPMLIAEAFRVRVVNDSDLLAETCTADLLEMNPVVEWLPLSPNPPREGVNTGRDRFCNSVSQSSPPIAVSLALGIAHSNAWTCRVPMHLSR